MEIKVTTSMLPDLLAAAALLTLAIYHLMIYWGRREDADETYNFFFSVFVLSATVFIVLPYFQKEYFLSAFKPSWLYILNVEMLTVWSLFYSGIKFLSLLLKFPPTLKKYFYFTFATLPICFLLTLTANFIGLDFYFKYSINYILLLVAVNTVVSYTVFGYWIYKERLYKNNFVKIFYLGFVLLTANILVYRTLELMRGPQVMVLNHYISAIILYIFAYALSLKFNKEHRELKELKEALEKKVIERTEELSKSYAALEQTNREIEDQKHEILAINEQLSLRAEELKELDRVKSRFFTNISHEFRTPLSLIIGPIETLLPKTNDAVIRTEYEIMLRQAKRLLALINQLLELSKVQKNMLNLDLCHDNFNKFLHPIISSFTSLAREMDIALSFVEEISEQYLWFDKDKVEKIITNLIANAFKFTNRGGKVEVFLRHNENSSFIEIIVRDTGIGLSPEQIKYVFDPFYQVDETRVSKLDGTGIGLSLVKELVGLHQGSINVTSEINQGTEFIVQLPIEVAVTEDMEIASLEEPYETGIPVSHDVVVTGKKQKIVKEKTIILLVEDNEDMRHFIKSHMPDDYQVIETANGKEGLEKALDIIPDLIIADVMMPVMDGLQMTRIVKRDQCISHIPVIILTAKATADNKMEGLETLADDYIVKPFNMQELTIRIRNLITNRQRLREKFSKSITVNPSEVVTTPVDVKFLQKALQIVEIKMSDAEFSATDFCNEINMSRTQVHRKLKALTDQSVTEFIRCIRLKRAAQLLKQNSGSVSEIAYQTGFNNLSYFTRCFKDQFNMLPSIYLNERNN